jgi:hypothetical protein
LKYHEACTSTNLMMYQIPIKSTPRVVHTHRVVSGSVKFRGRPEVQLVKAWCDSVYVVDGVDTKNGSPDTGVRPGSPATFRTSWSRIRCRAVWIRRVV